MRVVDGARRTQNPRGREELAPGTCDAPTDVAMVPFFEDDEDPKKPRPVDNKKKRSGWRERSEAAKDNDLDHHRHVHVRC